MDQELIAYLDQRFRETAQRIEESRQETYGQIGDLRKEMMSRFERVDSRFEQVDSRFEQVDSRFEQLDSRLDKVDGRLDKVDSRLDKVDGRLDKVDSRFDKVEEAIRHTQITVEGLRGDIRLLAEGIMGVDEKIVALRSEIQRDVKGIDSFVRLAHLELNDRVRPLETWRAQIGQDPVALVREKFGKKPDSSI